MPYGTLSTFDTLAASQQTVIDFGEDQAFAGIDALYAAHNEIMREQLAALVDFTTDQLRRYGGADQMNFDEVDEMGRADAQKVTAGVNVGFPMRLHQLPLQWTRRYFLNKTGAELAAQATSVLDAHRRRVSREVRRAIFNPTNNSSYVDRLMDQVVLPLRALVNADSNAIPPGPNGETFDASTHTHYLARVSTLAASDIDAVLETVREHFTQGTQFLYINRAQEAAIRAFTTRFTAYQSVQIIPADNTQRSNRTLDETNLYNRAIGVWDNGTEIWVKPWIPANYMFTYLSGAPRPLALRERRPGSSNLIVAAEDEQYPLRARFAEAEFGVGVWTRTNGAVLYTGGTSYVAPTITD